VAILSKYAAILIILYDVIYLLYFLEKPFLFFKDPSSFEHLIFFK
jgi:hypothetical protein